MLQFEREQSVPLGYMLTAKKGVMESPDAITTGTFIHVLRHPPTGRKTWLSKLDKLAGSASEHSHQFYVVEMIELLDTRYAYISIYLP